MKRLARWLQGLKLNQKFTLAILSVVVVPVVLLAWVLFGNMQGVVVDDKIKDVQKGLAETQAGVEKAVELCNLTTQFFLNNNGLREFLVRAKTGYEFTTGELIAFSRGEVASLEKLVAANPYLYQVRVYYASETLPEFMPILYHQSRMQRLAWAQGEWQSGAWQLEYADTIFPTQVMKPTRHIMSLVTAIEDGAEGRLGVLEVAIRMDELLPGLYAEGESALGSLVTEGGVWYSGTPNAAFWQQNRQAVATALGADGRGVQTVSATLAGREALVSSVPLGQLGGQYVSVVFLSEITARISQMRNLFLVVTVLSLALLALVVNLLVKAMLRRFYGVMAAISQVQAGSLEVAVPGTGADEIGALGRQLNDMLDRIRALMQENVNRELLAKSSELRALQSQINAHFLYNVLESIKMMAEVEGQYALADAITSLGRLLRYSMKWTSASVTLADELEHLQNYLLLVNLRYDYTVQLRQSLSPEMLATPLPRLTLQPIVENALQHGEQQLAGDAVIDIAAREENGCLALTVTDYGRGMPPEELAALRARLAGGVEGGPGGGIGLKNVQDRIVMAYGPAFGLAVESSPGEYTRVTIRVPAREESLEQPADS